MNRRTFLLITFLTAASLLCAGCQTIDLLTNKENTTLPTVAASELQTTSINTNENLISGKTEAAASASATPLPKPKSKLANAVCPNPAKPCKNKNKEFAEWEMSFGLSAKIKPNSSYKSAPFYAIILKVFKASDDDCDGGEYTEKIEKERLSVQKSYPTRKVFADHMCPNMDAVDYDFPGRRNKENVLIYNFIAVYAGETQEEANALLAEVRAKFPKAVVKRMTVNWDLIEQ